MIREVLTIGAVFYVLLAILQAGENSLILLESVVLVLFLIVVSVLVWLRDEGVVKRYEMVLVWCGVLLFLLYALLWLGGWI
jgi:hypothetical protein